MNTCQDLQNATRTFLLLAPALMLVACSGGGGYGLSAPAVNSVTPLVAIANAYSVWTWFLIFVL